MPQHTVAPVGDKQIVPAVIVIVSDTDALAPASVRDSGAGGDIGESPIAVVLVESADGRLSRRPTRFKARPVDEKDVEPAVIVIINKSATASGGFEQELVRAFTSENR